jgi:hypothetical protein
MSKRRGNIYGITAVDIRSGCWTTEDFFDEQELYQFELQEDVIMQEADQRIESTPNEVERGM